MNLIWTVLYIGFMDDFLRHNRLTINLNPYSVCLVSIVSCSRNSDFCILLLCITNRLKNFIVGVSLRFGRSIYEMCYAISTRKA